MRPVLLDGSRSFDPEGEPLTYRWLTALAPAGAQISLSSPTSDWCSFVPTLSGVYAFELTVADPQGLSDREQVVVTVGDWSPDAGADAGPDAGRDLDGGLHDVLDPEQVYLVGTLNEGTCGSSALARVDAPHAATTGFECDFEGRTAFIRPSDGRLLYFNSSDRVLRTFRCDACPYLGTYGVNVSANDAVIPRACPGNGMPIDFLVSPEGEILYTCDTGNRVWRDLSGATRFDESFEKLVAPGARGWMLTESRVFNVVTGESHGLTMAGASPVTANAVRWSPPDAFLFVATRVVGGGSGLYRVPVTTGVAQELGVFPSPPAGYFDLDGRLDRSGNLYRICSQGRPDSVDIVLRCVIGQACDEIYSEANNPLVRVDPGSRLVTGP